MDTPSKHQPQTGHKHGGSTRLHTVDGRFAALLTEDFGVPAATVLDALEGEPQKAAISICAWAERTDDRAFALTSWAKKHSKGRCRRQRTAPRTDRRSPREVSGSPGADRAGRGRGSGPARRRGVSGGLDPARVRANVERMGD